jgi:putative multiple sugar transport system substrate-binding protein
MALSREDFMKKLTSILATMALGVGLISTPVIAQDKGTVGIAMPTKSSARWISDGNSMVDQFTAAGYATDLQYAEDDIPNQLAQIENMITKGVDVLVIAAIDGTTLSNALENAAASGIKVIAYDRLIRDSGNVDYYATFDNFKVGVQQASSLVDGLKARFGDGPYNVELFGGSPDDNNAYFFYNGAMSVLQPLIDSGTSTSCPARWAWTRSARCAGTARSRRPAWITCCRPTTPTSRSTACFRPMTACPSASCPRSRASATAPAI